VVIERTAPPVLGLPAAAPPHRHSDAAARYQPRLQRNISIFRQPRPSLTFHRPSPTPLGSPNGVRKTSGPPQDFVTASSEVVELGRNCDEEERESERESGREGRGRGWGVGMFCFSMCWAEHRPANTVCERSARCPLFLSFSLAFCASSICLCPSLYLLPSKKAWRRQATGLASSCGAVRQATDNTRVRCSNRNRFGTRTCERYRARTGRLGRALSVQFQCELHDLHGK